MKKIVWLFVCLSVVLPWPTRAATYTVLPKKTAYLLTGQNLKNKLADFATTRQVTYNWRYNNKVFSLTQTFDSNTYLSYKNDRRLVIVDSQLSSVESRSRYYALFLRNLYRTDQAVTNLTAGLKKLAKTNKLNDDQLIDLALSFVQALPYDNSKSDSILSGQSNAKQNFVYETLYTSLGVCSDKSLLAVALLRQLGYGAAIFDFPDIKHTAVGVACPKQYSLANTGYCYIESTNYFPVSIVPQGVSSGRVANYNVNNLQDQINNFFNASSLGTIQSLQATTGKKYYRVSETVKLVDQLKKLNLSIAGTKPKLNLLGQQLSLSGQQLAENQTRLTDLKNSGQLDVYNTQVILYNQQVDDYNKQRLVYNQASDTLNSQINELNRLLKMFYQLN